MRAFALLSLTALSLAAVGCVEYNTVGGPVRLQP